MDHADIVALIEAGERDAAVELIEARSAKRGISGEDAHTLAAMLATVDAPAEEPETDSEPEPKAAQSRRSIPRRSAGRKG